MRISLEANKISKGVETGTILYDAFDVIFSSIIPNGYLLCNGQQITSALYPDLCNKLGLQFATPANIALYETTDIPNMTSNSQSGYITSASTVSSADAWAVNGTAAWRAFDNNANGTYWLSASVPMPHFLTVQLPAPKAMNKFKLFQVNAIEIASNLGTVPVIMNLDIEGSMNGTSWNAILSSTTSPNISGMVYSSSNTIAYLYYRLKVNSTNIFQRTALGKFELFPVEVNQTNVPTISNLATGVRAIIKT